MNTGIQISLLTLIVSAEQTFSQVQNQSLADIGTSFADFYDRYTQHFVDESDFQTSQPAVGILTMPTQGPTELFPYGHHVWEHNANFVHYAGAYDIPIAFDVADDELYALLDQINGFYFTGGPLEMFSESGESHVYYETAKKIYRYAIG